MSHASFPSGRTRLEKRLLRAEKLIAQLIDAWDSSEMSNVMVALEKLRKFLSEI